MKGLLLLNKPGGITSFGAVAAVRRLTGERRVGHTGTLDPMATGVLPILVGRATVLSDYLLSADKKYTAAAKLGILTDTLDITGNVLEESDKTVDNAAVLSAIESFKGKYLQTPPMFSAIKKDGVRLYDIARKGGTTEIPPREVCIYEINETGALNENGEFAFSATVSKGTYIRSLVRDIGEKLGTHATLTNLVRTETAGFPLENCVSLDLLTAENIGRYIMPAEKALPHLKSVHVTEKQGVRFYNGGALSLERVNTNGAADGEILKVFSNAGFLGLGAVSGEKGLLTVKCIV